MKKMAIIYLCTGEYITFWDKFYETANKFFVPDYTKRFFVFSDGIEQIKGDNVERFYQPKIGWPMDVLMKWDCICRIQDILQEYDYIALCNANMEFKDSLFFENENTDFWLTSFLDDYGKFNFERNSNSKAFIPEEKIIRKYIQTGFVVGKTEAFLKASRILRDWTSLDIENECIPVWHDESLFNAYIYMNEIESIGFFPQKDIYPEEWVKEGENPKAIFRDKNKYGGHNLLRGIDNKSMITVKQRMKKLIEKKFVIHKH